mmetsp:Transcript_8604/g.9800  ORF Transcript_8604/g.9800 Transcript_8604/m.9800 type:complete len:526 (-) Transcript_8604:78-1655(-)
MAPLQVLVGSWNVNACSPTSSKTGNVSLNSWLCQSPTPPGIVGVTLQEIVPLTEVKNYTSNKKSNDNTEDWRRSVCDTLKKAYGNVSYQTLEVHNLVGMMTLVLVQSDLFNRVSNVRVGNSVGRKGLGNKGAVSIRFDFQVDESKSTSMCFVGVHLTAHQENTEKRNQDIDAIMKRTVWNKLVPGDRKSLPRESLAIQRHENVFIFGDFNYRIEKIPSGKVVQMVKGEQYEKLVRAHDQLTKELARKRILHGFEEGSINFPPTFKFVPGTNQYRTKKGKKERIPSYCDRILWKSSNQVQQLSYYTTMDLVISDHKPVASQFVFPAISQAKIFMESEEKLSPDHGPKLGSAMLQTVQSLEDYRPHDQLKLSVKKDDIIDVLSEDMLSTDGTDSWHLGRSQRTGKVGYFNSHFCRMVGVQETEMSKDTREMAEKFRALSYHRHVMELAALNDDSEFFENQTLNRKGRKSKSVVKSTRRYNQVGDFEVSIEKGEVVQILSRQSDKSRWVFVRKENNKEGLLPSVCLKL